MRARLTHREDGASLVLVLIFTSLFGLVIAGLLTEAGASVKFTSVVSDHEKKVYAADAGVSFGIQQLQQNNEVCPGLGMGGGPEIPDLAFEDHTVSVTCTAVDGSTLGASGLAVITTESGADSLKLSTAETPEIDGGMFVNGEIDWGSKDLNITIGNFYQHDDGSGCPTLATGGLNVTPPYLPICSAMTWDEIDPLHEPPSATSALVDRVKEGNNHATCRTFSPGEYDEMPVLVAENYFQSGVYYFNFDGNLLIKDNTVIGGQPDPAYDTRRLTTPVPSCADPSLEPSSDYGVQLVLGNKASIDLDSHGAVELFRPSFTTTRISLIAVPNEVAWTSQGWTANTLAVTEKIVDIKDGSPLDFVVHGLMYTPRHPVLLTATPDKLVQTLGGLVARTVELKASAHAAGLEVSVLPGGAEPRYIRIEATADGLSGDQTVTSTAIVQIANDAGKTTVIRSWRTPGPSDG